MRLRALVTAEERTEGQLSPVRVVPGGRYFATSRGKPFLLIAQNEAMIWTDLTQLYRRRNVAATQAYLQALRDNGITVLRMMLEYCQPPYPRFFEKPVGRPVPATVRFWDDLFALCEKYGLCILMTPWETFFMSRNWRQHPYNRRNGGPCKEPGDFMVLPAAIEVERARFRYIIERWGSSPAFFGFDLFNEIHPFWGGSHADRVRWVEEMAAFIRTEERARYGYTHPLTVSIFGAMPEGEEADLIYRNPALDFATTHVYGESSVDVPRNTIDAALFMNRAVRYALEQIQDNRPYTDSESGPIHLFGNLHHTLPADFDEEYFHNMSWAHLASGGAGGGMRWPCRHPHRLTPGMLAIQQGLARFIDDCGIEWQRFVSANIDHMVRLDLPHTRRSPLPPLIAMGCGDERAALIWILQDRRAKNGRNKLVRSIEGASLQVACLKEAGQTVTVWDTTSGRLLGTLAPVWQDGTLSVSLPQFTRDLVVVIR